MAQATAIDKYIYEEEADEIGGVLVLYLGSQGSGKTVGLANKAKISFEDDNIVFWRGQKSCQWVLMAANSIPVTIWLHESISSFETFLTGDLREGIRSKYVELEEQDEVDIRVKRFSSVEELAENPDVDRANVYYVPGDKAKNEKDRYFFLKKHAEFFEALNNRNYGNHVVLLMDEVGDVFSTDQKNPFYQILNFEMPEEAGEFRKNNVSLHGAGHDTSDIHFKLWKVKANTRAYMQGAKVKSKDKQIDQKRVNNLRKGELIMSGYPGWEKEYFRLPHMPHETIPWMPENSNIKLKANIEADIPNIIPEKQRIEKKIEDSPLRNKHIDEIIDVDEAADIIGVTSRQVHNLINQNKVPAIMAKNKYFLARTNVSEYAKAD